MKQIISDVLQIIVAILITGSMASAMVPHRIVPVHTKLAVKSVPKPKTLISAVLPQPPVKPAVVLSPAISGSCGQYDILFRQYAWNVQTAEAICQAESSGVASKASDPGLNYDGISDYGLMQLHGVDILDPAQNISYAYYHKYLTQGWNAWSSYKSGTYLRDL